MPRLVFLDGDQKVFLKAVKEKSKNNYDFIASVIEISGRSLRDWVNEKTLGDKEKLVKLSKLFKVTLPKILEEREDWWSGRVNGSVGAKARFLKHGIVATQKGRKLGGINSQINRKNNPEYYRSLGCKVAKVFKKPGKSELLAEWIGIVLGDGSLTNDQCQISLDLKTDKNYSEIVLKNLEELFDISAGIFEYPKQSLIRLIISGVGFVKMMKLFGLKTGNKVVHQVGIPEWITKNKDYYRSCVKGLFDTDGGSFTHLHRIKNYKYRHFGLTFTSASKPLMKGFENYLKQENIRYSVKDDHLFIYAVDDVKKFFETVKPNNTKHFDRFQKHMSVSTRLN